MAGLVLLLLTAVDPAAMRTEATMVFIGETVIAGAGAPPIPNSVMLAEGEWIHAVGPRNTLPILPATQVMDNRGKWIIPGLIDAHIHFFPSGGLST